MNATYEYSMTQQFFNSIAETQGKNTTRDKKQKIQYVLKVINEQFGLKRPVSSIVIKG